MERDDFSAFLFIFTQSLDSVRPSRNPNWVNGIRIFQINDREIIVRPQRLFVYRIVVPVLRFNTTMGE